MIKKLTASYGMAALSIVFVFCLLTVYAIIFWRQSQGLLASDLLAHVRFIGTRLDSIVHPIFHWTTKITSDIFDVDLSRASVFVLLFYSLLSGCCFFYTLQAQLKGLYEWPALIIASGTLMVVSAVWLPVFNENIYLGVGTPNVMHNPTLITVKPFAFLVLIIYSNLVLEDRFSRRMVALILCSVVSLLSVLAKPNFAFAAIFSMPLWLVFCLRNENIFNWRRFIILLYPILLMVGCLMYQYFSKYGMENSSSKVVFDFLGVASLRSSNVFISLLLLSLFPFLLIVFFPKVLNSYMVLATCATYIIACLQFIFLAESGPRYNAGNFGWGRQILISFVFCVCLAEFLKLCRMSLNKIEKAKVTILAVIYIVHIISGVIYFNQLLKTDGYY